MLAAHHPPAPDPRSAPGNAARQLREVAVWRLCRDVVSTRPSVAIYASWMFGRRLALSTVAAGSAERSPPLRPIGGATSVDRFICKRR